MSDNETQLELTLILSVAEINYLLAALSKQPYDEVCGLITKVKVQGDAQLKELAEAQEQDQAA